MGYKERNVRRLSRQGMSLVEVTVAMGLASVMFLGLTQMAGFAFKNSRNVAQTTEWSELRNGVRSALRSPSGCTYSMRLMHDSTRANSGISATSPSTPGGGAGGALAAHAELPNPNNRVRPLRNMGNAPAPGNPPGTPPFNFNQPCANSGIPFFTVTGNDRIATVGATQNGLLITCIHTEVLSASPNTTNWTHPFVAGNPQGIPHSGTAGVPISNVRLVTYGLTLTARKMAVAGTDGGNMGGSSSEYGETFRVSAWVDAANGKILGCSEVESVCDAIGGVSLNGHNPSCVPEKWIVGRSTPSTGEAWNFAEERMDIALAAGASAGGIHSRSGLVMPVTVNPTAGWTTATSSTAYPTTGGIVFDNGKNSGADMAAIRVASGSALAGTDEPTTPTAVSTNSTSNGTLWIMGQPNYTGFGSQTLALDNRRVGIRGSMNIELQGPLTLSDPWRPARQVEFSYGSSNAAQAALPAILNIDTAPGTTTRTGEVNIFTGSFAAIAEGSSALEVTNAAGTHGANVTASPGVLTLSSTAPVSGVGLDTSITIDAASQEVRLSHGGAGTARLLFDGAASGPTDNILMQGGNGFLRVSAGNAQLLETYVDTGARLVIGNAAALGYDGGHLELTRFGTIRMGTGPRWRVIDMGTASLSSSSTGGYPIGTPFPVAGQPTYNRYGTASVALNGCAAANLHVQATLISPIGDCTTHSNNIGAMRTAVTTAGTNATLTFGVSFINADCAFQANYIAYCIAP